MAGVGGWQLVRFTPEGEVDRIVEVPVEKPTKVAFGGPAWTCSTSPRSARARRRAREARQPQAGGIFATRVPGVVGVAQPRFAG